MEKIQFFNFIQQKLVQVHKETGPVVAQYGPKLSVTGPWIAQIGTFDPCFLSCGRDQSHDRSSWSQIRLLVPGLLKSVPMFPEL